MDGSDEENSKRKVMRPRPGHADLVGIHWPIVCWRSARETVMRVAVGAVGKRLLAELGIDVHGFVLNIGPVRADAGQIAQYKTLAELRAVTESFPTRTLDAETDEKMRTLLDDTKRDYNTVGGTVQVIATGVPVGLGSYVSADTKLDAKIARIIGINAFSVEFGGGFENAEKFGSEVMDENYWSEERGFYRGSNNLRFEGGMTNGEPVVYKITCYDVLQFQRFISKTLSSVKCRYRYP